MKVFTEVTQKVVKTVPCTVPCMGKFTYALSYAGEIFGLFHDKSQAEFYVKSANMTYYEIHELQNPISDGELNKSSVWNSNMDEAPVSYSLDPYKTKIFLIRMIGLHENTGKTYLPFMVYKYTDGKLYEENNRKLLEEKIFPTGATFEWTSLPE